jgi:hypothetical protein
LDSLKVGITAWELCIFFGLIHAYNKLSQTDVIYQHIITNYCITDAEQKASGQGLPVYTQLMNIINSLCRSYI